MKKILIVDDLDNNRLSLVLILEKIDGVIISEASDGQEALELCARESFDLIFMDIMMPNLDGFEATKFIKKLLPHTMIIALSALDDELAKNKMLSLGAEDYLTKPIDPTRITLRIEHYLNIIAFRKQHHIESKQTAINPFDKRVFSKKIIYNIENKNNLMEFWDDCLNTQTAITDMSDVVRLMYGFGLWLLKNDFRFEIYIESNNECTYLTLLHKGTLRQKIVKNILFKHYAYLHYFFNYQLLSFKLKNILAEITTKEKKVKQPLENNTHLTLDAKQYIEITPINFLSKIDHLDLINDKIDLAILEFEKMPNCTSMRLVCNELKSYTNVLAQLMEFEHLGYALEMLVNNLLTLEESSFNHETTKKTAIILLNIVSDLASWRENIFIKQSAIDIHYLDASLLSSCMQLESIFEPESESNDDNEIEFF